MILPPIPWRHSVEGATLLLAVSFLFGSFAMRDVFRTKRMVVFYTALAAFFFVTHAMWELGPVYPIRYWGAALTVCGLLVSILVAASLPVAAILRAVARRFLLRKKPASAAEISLGRAGSRREAGSGRERHETTSSQRHHRSCACRRARSELARIPERHRSCGGASHLGRVRRRCRRHCAVSRFCN